MVLPPDGSTGISRRSVVLGTGGIASIPLTGVSFPEARAAGYLDDTETDPHTRDVFRSIVDAIVPRTPNLADDLGPAYEPGGLDVGLEQFLVWDFNHFQEIRAEAVTHASPERFEAAFDPDVMLDSLEELDGSSLTSHDAGAFVDRSLLDLGTLERFVVDIENRPEEGPVDLAIKVATASETIHRVSQNYPYAEALAIAFELVAVEFVARGGNEQPPTQTNDAYQAGGVFVRLAPRDRLRCLETIIDGGGVDTVDDAIGELVPTVGVLKFAVMGVFGLATLGYYSEWTGYGDTKTASPNDRELETPPGEVVGREQTGYPGPSRGYAAHRGFEVQSFRENDWGDGS